MLGSELSSPGSIKPSRTAMKVYFSIGKIKAGSSNLKTFSLQSVQ